MLHQPPKDQQGAETTEQKLEVHFNFQPIHLFETYWEFHRCDSKHRADHCKCVYG